MDAALHIAQEPKIFLPESVAEFLITVQRIVPLLSESGLLISQKYLSDAEKEIGFHVQCLWIGGKQSVPPVFS